jgi:hypothetical protein
MESSIWKSRIRTWSIGFGLLLGALLYFSVMLIGFAILLDLLAAPKYFELRLFIDSLSKPIGVTAVALWFFLFGKILDRPKAIAWAKGAIVLYAAAAVVPYFLSFFISP